MPAPQSSFMSLRLARPGRPAEEFRLPFAQKEGQPFQLPEGRMRLFNRNGSPVMFAQNTTVADVHQPEELATFLQGFKAPGFRADELSEIVPVDHEQDYYRSMSADNVFVPIPVDTDINSAPMLINPSHSLVLYTVGHRMIGSFVNDIIEREAQKAYRPRIAALKYIQQMLMLDREIKVITLLSTAANWATNQKVQLGAGFQWNGGASSDPIKDMQARVDASDQEAVEFWMNPRTNGYFLRHPSVRDHMRQMNGDNPQPSGIPSSTEPKSVQMTTDYVIPGIGQVRLAKAKKRNLTTDVNDYIWPDGYIALLVRTPGAPADMESIATTKTFRTRGPQGTGYGTREYRMEGIGPEGGTVIIVHQADVAVMTGNTCGGLIYNAIQ